MRTWAFARLQFILETTPPDRRTLAVLGDPPKAIVTLATHYQKDALHRHRSDTAGHADIEYRAVRIAGTRSSARGSSAALHGPAGRTLFSANPQCGAPHGG